MSFSYSFIGVAQVWVCPKPKLMTATMKVVGILRGVATVRQAEVPRVAEKGNKFSHVYRKSRAYVLRASNWSSFSLKKKKRENSMNEGKGRKR